MPVAARPSAANLVVGNSRSFEFTSFLINGESMPVVSATLRFSMRDSHPTLSVASFDSSKSRNPDDFKNTVGGGVPAIFSFKVHGALNTINGVVDHVTYSDDISGAKYVTYSIVPKGFVFFRASTSVIFLPPSSMVGVTSDVVISDPGDLAGRMNRIVSKYNSLHPNNRVSSSIGDGVTQSLALDGVRMLNMTYANMINEMVAPAGYRIKMDFDNKIVVYSVIKPTSSTRTLTEADYTNPSVNIDTIVRSL